MASDLLESAYQKSGWTGLDKLVNTAHGLDPDKQVEQYKQSILDGHRVPVVDDPKSGTVKQDKQK